MGPTVRLDLDPDRGGGFCSVCVAIHIQEQNSRIEGEERKNKEEK